MQPSRTTRFGRWSFGAVINAGTEPSHQDAPLQVWPIASLFCSCLLCRREVPEVCVDAVLFFGVRSGSAGVGDQAAEFGDADHPLVVGVVGELLVHPVPDQRGDLDAAAGGQRAGGVQRGGW